MALMIGNGHSNLSSNQRAIGNAKMQFGRACVNFHPSVWGDQFAKCSPNDFEVDAQTKQRAEKLKEEVRKMLLDVNDSLQELNLINEIQRLGFSYHFEKKIKNTLQRIYNSHIDGKNDGDDLHTVALQFRLLRQEGYNISSDRAITYTKEHLQSALPHLNSPFSTLVELTLDVPLRKYVERLQSRYYISIYQQEKERNDILLEFAKLDFNMVQAFHRKEISEISRWWKEGDFARKLPFIRDRVVECYFWVLGVYFEPHYSRARRMMTTVISLTSILDDIYDVYGTLEELELYTATLERWDRAAMDQLPEYMKLHFDALLSAVEKFKDELSQEGEAYRISYLKKAYIDLAKSYLIEARWASLGYQPTFDEYMANALLSSGYPMLTVVSLVGMENVATKEVFEWAINIPKVVKACSTIGRLKDDITSNKLEQERVHVCSAIECYMKEHGLPYAEACKILRENAESAWKDLNRECMEPITIPRQVIKRPINLARVIEVLYQHKDAYTDSAYETKDRITMLLVDPIPL